VMVRTSERVSPTLIAAKSVNTVSTPRRPAAASARPRRRR
jgi:hypothetical protein